MFLKNKTRRKSSRNTCFDNDIDLSTIPFFGCILQKLIKVPEKIFVEFDS